MIDNFESYKEMIDLSDSKADDMVNKLLRTSSKSNELFIILEVENELYLEPIIDQLFIQEIANKDREFVIGKKIYKYERDFVKVGGFTDDGRITWNDNEVQVINRDYSTGSRVDLHQCNSSSYNFSGFTRRVSGEVSRVCAWVYSELKVSSKHRRKSWTGAWTYSDTQQMRMGDTGQTSVGFNTACIPLANCTSNNSLLFTENNASAIHHIIDFGINCAVCPVHCSTNLNYSAICLDNVVRGCSIVN